MKNFRTLTIWVAILYFIIIIGAGHGVVCIGLLEIFMLPHFFNIASDNFTFSLTASYEESLSAAMLFAFIGHLLLITSILIKQWDKKIGLKISGLIFLWISFYYLVHDVFTDGLCQLSFFSGLPFIICSVILLYRLLKSKSIY
jgi:hypothetical protein